MIFQQQLGHRFVVGIGGRLVVKHRLGPILLHRLDRFLIPIGSLHQPHGHGRAALLRPGHHALQIGVGIAQIGLQRQANIGAIAELRLHQHRFQRRQRRILIFVLLHVEVHRRAQFLGPPQQHPRPIGRFRLGSRHIQRVELGIERRQLHGHLHLGQGLTVRLVDLGDRRPALGRRHQLLHQFQIAIEVLLGLHFRDHGLAEQIDGEGHFVLPQPLDRPNRLLDRLPRNVLLRQGLHGRAHRRRRHLTRH